MNNTETSGTMKLAQLKKAQKYYLDIMENTKDEMTSIRAHYELVYIGRELRIIRIQNLIDSNMKKAEKIRNNKSFNRVWKRICKYQDELNKIR